MFRYVEQGMYREMRKRLIIWNGGSTLASHLPVIATSSRRVFGSEQRSEVIEGMKRADG
jgi:hypothetical protein